MPAYTPGAMNVPGALGRGRRTLIRACLLLVLCALFLEVAIRVKDAVQGVPAIFRLTGGQYDIYEAHPFLHYRLKPSYDVRSDFYYGTDFRTNRLGFRSPEIAIEKPAGVRRILCLGGSNTYCTGASRMETAWPFLLQAALNEAPPVSGVRYEVINTGVPGWSSVHVLALMQTWGLALSPDLVIAHLGSNEFFALAEEMPPDYSNYFRPYGPDRMASRSLPEHSQLFLSVRNRLHLLCGGGDVTRARGQEPLDALPEGYARVYERNLRSLHAICRENGIPLSLMTQECILAVPGGAEKFQRVASYGVSDRLFLEALAGFNETTRAFSVERGLPLLDHERDFPLRAEWCKDYIHLNEEGLREFATVVERGVRSWESR